MMDIEQHLNMSLDAIEKERKDYNSSPTSNIGKWRNKGKRADRKAQASPYLPNSMKQQRMNQINRRRSFKNIPYHSNTSSGSLAARRVYVGNLSWSVKWQDLKDHMKQVGEVEHADILEEINGRSKGCGIVTFTTSEAAQEAIARLNDTELDGRPIFVREDREVHSPGSSTHQHDGCRVYVGNLSWNVKWQDLKDHMKSAGNVAYCDVLEEGNSGRSKGCGLVEYETPEEAQRAIETLNDTTLEGRLIFVREDREPGGGSISSIAHRNNFSRGPPGPRNTTPIAITSMNINANTLYIGNLPWDTTWQSLKDLFRTVGEVDRSEIATFPDGKSRGFGIIRFFNPQDAKKAIDMLHGAKVNGREIEVRYDKAK